MTTPGPGSGVDRVLVDPADLRALATRLLGAAELLASVGRDLATMSRPHMPAAVDALVGEAIHAGNSVLQELAIELDGEARVLAGRADAAEFGGGDAFGWLVPGWHGLTRLPGLVGGAGEALQLRSAVQMRAAESWAVDVLENSLSGRAAPPPAAGHLTSAPDLSSTQFASPQPLGKFTLASVAGPDLGGTSGMDEAATGDPVRGALAAGLSGLSRTPTGDGIAGCILVGLALDEDPGSE